MQRYFFSSSKFVDIHYLYLLILSMENSYNIWSYLELCNKNNWNRHEICHFLINLNQNVYSKSQRILFNLIINSFSCHMLLLSVIYHFCLHTTFAFRYQIHFDKFPIFVLVSNNCDFLPSLMISICSCLFLY